MFPIDARELRWMISITCIRYIYSNNNNCAIQYTVAFVVVTSSHSQSSGIQPVL